MRNLKELRINEGGNPVSHPEPTDADVRSIERAVGAPLPSEYVALLKHANGGHPEIGSFWVEDRGRRERWSVNVFYGLGADKGTAGSVWKAVGEWRSVLGDRALPIANDGGGNQIFLSFDQNPPSVKLCVHDERFKILRVANSFDAFLGMLEEDPDLT
jgi:hypothetical protein